MTHGGKAPSPAWKNILQGGYAQIAYYDKAIFVFLCMDEIKVPVDLGHDDVEGQECKDGRSRTWMILLYPDDPTHKAVLDGKLFELDWNFAGRVHDKDEGVKEHHHVVVLFKDGRKNTDIAKDLGIDKRWLRAWDRQKKAFRYLCHKDNPGKYQYSPDGIYGTLAEKAVGACSKGSELSEKQGVDEIIKLIDSLDGYVSYKCFLGLVNSHDLYAVFRRMGNGGIQLLKEHNATYAREIELEHAKAVGFTADKATFERFIKWETENPEGIEWINRVNRLERQGFFAPPEPLE